MTSIVIPDGVTSIALAYSEPKVEGKTITFGAIEFVDQNGEVIDFAALNTTETYTTKIPVEGVFENGDVVALYHDGEMIAGTTVANGYAIYEAPHFCEVKVVDAKSVYDYVVSDLAGLTKAFANGGKVLMAADIQFEKILAVEPGDKVADLYSGVFRGGIALFAVFHL